MLLAVSSQEIDVVLPLLLRSVRLQFVIIIVLLPQVPARTIYTGKNVTWITWGILSLFFTCSSR